MIRKIRNYVEDIFEDKPKSKKINELKEELIANLTEKYNDLLKEKSEEEAYNIVVASIGDIDELISDLNGDIGSTNIYNAEYQNRRAKCIAASVMLYILSVVPAIYFEEAWGQAEVGAIMMFIMVAIATGLLVYIGASKPKYLKANDTLVEEFKEWKSHKNQTKRIRSAILSAFWLSIIALYFILSFIFSIWSYSWIIFIIGAAMSQVIKALFEIRGE
jgi:uncharacterized membrane protein